MYRGAKLVLAGISTYVVCISMLIEYANACAGGILPRQADAQWHTDPRSSETGWREWASRQLDDATLRTRPLSQTELADMLLDIKRADYSNWLRGIVGSVGLLQYLVCPSLMVCSSIAVFGSKSFMDRITYTSYATIGLLTLMAAFGRQYFTSLGM